MKRTICKNCGRKMSIPDLLSSSWCAHCGARRIGGQTFTPKLTQGITDVGKDFLPSYGVCYGCGGDCPHVVVVTDEDCGDEAMYLSGKLVSNDSTIYASDVAAATEKAGGGPIEFSHVLINNFDGKKWPQEFEELTTYIVDN